MGLEDFDNPYRAPEVAFEVAREASNGGFFWIRFWIIVQAGVAVIGTAAAFSDVHSIMFTGLILSGAGVLGILASVRRQHYLGIWIGLSGPAISLGVFLIILLFDLSPTDAQQPIPIIGAVYALAICAIGVIALRGTHSLQNNLSERISVNGQ
jgi:peptidoglycan/LPS O-acetylase OafA/YrhL